ncbi:MAG TPA: CHC2 zinc finger domain-containing protein [Longilinea sp.]|nr:CHC2 zinc finger domain-containing protein [Longilinea sp.]
MDQEKWRLIKDLTSRFINRNDLYAKQLPDGRYFLVTQRLTPIQMLAHLKGQITMGTYVLNQESYAQFMVLDADDTIDGITQVQQKLEKLDIPTYLEASRRGGHLWFFFDHKIPGFQARGFGLAICHRFGLDLEVFPKQNHLVTGPGSLIRVPFGFHRKSNVRYEFIGLGTLRQQVEALCHPLTVALDKVNKYQYQEPTKEYLISRLAKDIPIAEFIGQYVTLKPVASGFVGLCPFHQDKVPSFGINTSGNFWHCFAGCGGGDVVNFWMRWRGISYRQANVELEEYLKSRR